jgi:hypothetical protein
MKKAIAVGLVLCSLLVLALVLRAHFRSADRGGSHRGAEVPAELRSTVPKEAYLGQWQFVEGTARPNTPLLGSSGERPSLPLKGHSLTVEERGGALWVRSKADECWEMMRLGPNHLDLVPGHTRCESGTPDAGGAAGPGEGKLSISIDVEGRAHISGQMHIGKVIGGVTRDVLIDYAGLAMRTAGPAN